MASGVAASTGRFGSVAIISAIVVAVLGGLIFKGWGTSAAGGGSQDTSKLPFGGQFPVARLTATDFTDKVGLPSTLVPGSGPRDFGLFLLFNTLDASFNCPSCSLFDKEFTNAASKFKSEERLTKQVHFATFEYKNNEEIFTKARIAQIPTLLYLPPTAGYPTSDYMMQVRIYDLKHGPSGIGGFMAEVSHLKLDALPGPKIGMFMFTIGTALIFAAVLKLYVGESLIKVISSYKLWAVFSIVFMSVMTSGYMWVRIRGAPYTVISHQGTQVFAPGLHAQLGIEAQMIATLNCVGAVALIALGTKVPTIRNPQARRVAVIAMMAAALLAFSAEIALFRRKLGYYPFRLIFP